MLVRPSNVVSCSSKRSSVGSVSSVRDKRFVFIRAIRVRKLLSVACIPVDTSSILALQGGLDCLSAYCYKVSSSCFFLFYTKVMQKFVRY